MRTKIISIDSDDFMVGLSMLMVEGFVGVASALPNRDDVRWRSLSNENRVLDYRSLLPKCVNGKHLQEFWG